MHSERRPAIPLPGQESVWDYPRPPRIEPNTERIRIYLGGELILDTTDSLRVLETSHPPAYYLPRSEFRPGALEPAPGSSFCEFKGPAKYLTVRGGGEVREKAAWFYPNPVAAYAALLDRVAVYPGRMDYCEVEGERVRPQAGGYYGGWITGRVTGPFKGGPGSLGW
ncbi:DUF427 domain-containing protein [Pseudarthrobacter sp. NPDC058329]|uniref:DUF427 domain-containing protein n=1 Tax=Pseudarthrobacter sp. NPDC058329 TaxID=3346448 RepID=UPI0036DC5074